MNLKTCVSPSGNFVYGIHKPNFEVQNLRETDEIDTLGMDENRSPVDNRVNFPAGSVDVPRADWIFEIPNAFPFRGATYIAKRWADRKAGHPEFIRLPEPPEMSVSDSIGKWIAARDHSDTSLKEIFESMPEPLQLATAVNTTDPEDLVRLAHISCRFVLDPTGTHPTGLKFKTRNNGKKTALIHNHALFEALANNPHLPDMYKVIMVLKPGVQGISEIVGEWHGTENHSHVYEYLRKNSYIPWGHYAANMADDAIRYRIEDLTLNDMIGMRHLYYQRTYVRMANQLGLSEGIRQKPLTVVQLEALRQKIYDQFSKGSAQKNILFDRTLWGWNFGFDYAPSRYRLHASHQQVHQQYALLPAKFTTTDMTESSAEPISCYGHGDLIEDFIRSYHRRTEKSFFDCYIQAIRNNRRMDGNRNKPRSLIVYKDDRVILFVPKAQTSQWELQLMTRAPMGNILETNTTTRRSIDRAIYYTIKTLGAMGARMITSIELSKRFDAPDLDQRLLYSFLPRLPESPGAFSEAQLRWINGHYPEDFAAACRNQATKFSA
ncbi:MAG: hypothetical protein U9Q05_00480 [Thermodesulfobacteriota bacterium]|nr:hypothetical protein [Thermodesulfobacteriota bacterium]